MRMVDRQLAEAAKGSVGTAGSWYERFFRSTGSEEAAAPARFAAMWVNPRKYESHRLAGLPVRVPGRCRRLYSKPLGSAVRTRTD